MPALQLNGVHVGSAHAPREWKYVFPPPPHSKNEIQSGRSRLLHVAITERIFVKRPAKGASIHIEIIWQKVKILTRYISNSNVFSVA
jgi:hypothetical protein